MVGGHTMKKREKVRTITLNKETLRRLLTPEELNKVGAGTDDNGETDCKRSWCACTRYPA
jgi:hypothetical protein